MHLPCNDGPRQATLGCIIHSTRGEQVIGVEYLATLNWFSNCAAEASANVVFAQDGRIAITVDLDLASWGAGAFNNARYLNVELEQPWRTTPYTDLQYQLLASFLREVSASYGFPLDRAHVLGHDETTQGQQQGQTDPGVMFDWNYEGGLWVAAPPPPPPPPVEVGSAGLLLGLGALLAGGGVYLFARARGSAA